MKPPPSLMPFLNATAGLGVSVGDVSSANHYDDAVATFAGSNAAAALRTADSDVAALTLQCCRCPHLDAILPHVLRLDRYDPVVELHLGKNFGDVAPLSASLVKLAGARAQQAAAAAAEADHKGKDDKMNVGLLPPKADTSKGESGTGNGSSDGGEEKSEKPAGSKPAPTTTTTTAAPTSNTSSVSINGKPTLPVASPNRISVAEYTSKLEEKGTPFALKLAAAARGPLPAPSQKAAADAPSSPSKASTKTSTKSASSSSGTGSKSQRTDRAIFGPEHARLLAVTGRGGAAETWCPVLPPLYQPSGSAGSKYNSEGGNGDGKDSGGKKKKSKAGGSKDERKRKQSDISGGGTAASTAVKAGDTSSPTKSISGPVSGAVPAVPTMPVKPTRSPLGGKVATATAAATAAAMTTPAGADNVDKDGAAAAAAAVAANAIGVADTCTGPTGDGSLPPPAPMVMATTSVPDTSVPVKEDVASVPATAVAAPDINVTSAANSASPMDVDGADETTKKQLGKTIGLEGTDSRSETIGNQTTDELVQSGTEQDQATAEPVVFASARNTDVAGGDKEKQMSGVDSKNAEKVNAAAVLVKKEEDVSTILSKPSSKPSASNTPAANPDVKAKAGDSTTDSDVEAKADDTATDSPINADIVPTSTTEVEEAKLGESEKSDKNVAHEHDVAIEIGVNTGSAPSTAASQPDVQNEVAASSYSETLSTPAAASVPMETESLEAADKKLEKEENAQPMDVDGKVSASNTTPIKVETEASASISTSVKHDDEESGGQATLTSQCQRNILDPPGSDSTSFEVKGPLEVPSTTTTTPATLQVTSADENITSEPTSTDQPPVPIERPPPQYLLPDSRYNQLRSRERRITRERDNVMLKARKLPPNDDIRSIPGSQPKSPQRPAKRMKKEVTIVESAATATATAVVSDDELSSERRMLRSRAFVASSKVEEWLEVIRDGREAYAKEQTSKRSSRHCAWCPQSFEGVRGAYRGPAGDELMQCLECGVVGCGPSSTCPDSSMHMIRHFIASGHSLGITCGPRAEIFCMKCGDFVYHEVFDQEKERIDLARYVPQYGWEAGPLCRSYEPLSFVSTPDHGVVWRGMMASYPAPVPLDLVVAGRLSMKRLLVFRGEMEVAGGCSLWGPATLRLAIRQSRLGKNAGKIKAPVGMYNLGNTCFMSSVLQCLVNCSPIQQYFLRDVRHNHKSCEFLRASERMAPSSPVKSGGKTQRHGICIACEMDRLLLEYYGSTIGQDVMSALDEPPSPSPCSVNSIVCSSSNEKCGTPLVPSRLLTATWRSGGMKHLAGYQQRDSHEFLSAFLDSMGKHDRHYSSSIEALKHEGVEAASVKSEAPVQNIVDDLFTGKLRSVLICETCGYKRSQPEPFLNISLPITQDTKTIESCLRHFTLPENLTDPVVCPSCATKTPTRKQLTFAKLPKILCLHLKRFDAATNKKITAFVSFPAQGLNLGLFLPHWCEVIQGMKSPDALSSSEKEGAAPQIMYDLYATVNHTGTLHQGHYVSNIKIDGKWYHCNDAFVCDAGEGDGEKAVLKADGVYMLFYMRRDVRLGES